MALQWLTDNKWITAERSRLNLIVLELKEFGYQALLIFWRYRQNARNVESVNSESKVVFNEEVLYKRKD